MEKILDEWELADLIPIFKEHGITPDNMKKLTESLIKELIPNIGKRMKFTEKWIKIVESSAEQNSQGAACASDFSSEIQDDCSISSMPIIYANDNQIEEANNSLYVVPIENRMVAFYGKENMASAMGLDFPDFDLKTLLAVSPYGDLISKYYKDHGILSEYMRNKLMDIIMKPIYDYILKHRLTHSQYNMICAKIITLFPNEVSARYYKSGRNINNSIVQAKGKLVDKVRNLLYKSPDKMYVRKRKLAGNPMRTSRNVTEEEKEASTWLKYNREPWTEVIRLWKLTHKYRIEAKNKTLSELIDCWPSLEDPRGDSLIETDFELMHPGKELLLLTNWEVFFDKIELLKKPQLLFNRDPILEDILNKLEDENISVDGQSALQLAALGRLVPSKGRLQRGKTHWKFSIAESIESIFIHCLNHSDVEDVVLNQKEKALKRKISYGEVQPYLILVGPQLSEITTVYVVVDKILYKISCVLKAIDILFKIFITLDLKYPPPSEHIYLLIQRGIFKISCDTDKSIPYIEDILKYLLE